MRYRLCTGLMKGGMRRYMRGINKMEAEIICQGGIVLREMCTLCWT